MAEADPDRSGIQSPRAFMGQRRAMQPRPDREAQLSQLSGHFLAVHPRHEGDGACLMVARKYLKSQIPESRGAAFRLPVFPAIAYIASFTYSCIE